MKVIKDKIKDATVVIGVIGADCHAVGNKIIASILNTLGFNVINLGVMVTQEEYIQAAIEYDADAILVSSIYGHGEIDCQGLREKCFEHGIGDILLYVGGNLVIGKKSLHEVKSLFLDMGYNRVFANTEDFHDAVTCLKEDLKSRFPGLTYQTA